MSIKSIAFDLSISNRYLFIKLQNYNDFTENTLAITRVWELQTNWSQSFAKLSHRRRLKCDAAFFFHHSLTFLDLLPSEHYIDSVRNKQHESKSPGHVTFPPSSTETHTVRPKIQVIIRNESISYKEIPRR